MMRQEGMLMELSGESGLKPNLEEELIDGLWKVRQDDQVVGKMRISCTESDEILFVRSENIVNESQWDSVNKSV